MARDAEAGAPASDAMALLNPGPVLGIGSGQLAVDIAPRAGGRIAQIRFDGIDYLIGHSEHAAGAIAWGSYPMAPWAGRIREGRLPFGGRLYRLPVNFGEHAIHGVAFALPWQVDSHSQTRIELSLALPEDARWPFGGRCRQRIEVSARCLKMTLSVTAGAHAMPAAIGWHPWFIKPDRIDFTPTQMYLRDADGIVTSTRVTPPAGPWDDCFVNHDPVLLHRAGQHLRLTSDCSDWVVYDEPEHATCVEPQTGPPGLLGFGAAPLAAGASREAWFQLEWV